MRYRDAVLIHEETQGDTDTRTLDIDLVDPISALLIRVECTNGATSNKGNYLSDIITLVKVVDGSDVLASMSGSELQAMHFYKTGKIPAMYFTEYKDGGQRYAAYLLFGRYLWDREFALDPTRYKNPQLKVTFNKAAIRAAGAEGFADADNIGLTVVAKVMEGLTPPTKFLMQKQTNVWTGADGAKRIELPVDYVYRMLMFRFWLQGNDINECVSEIKMTCDSDKFIPFDRYVDELDEEAEQQFGVILWKNECYQIHQEYCRTVLNKEPRVSILADITDSPIYGEAKICFSSQFYVNIWDGAGNNVTTITKFQTLQEGHALHATLPLPFGELQKEDTWFDPTEYRKVELVLEHEDKASADSIVLEQVRPQ